MSRGSLWLCWMAVPFGIALSTCFGCIMYSEATPGDDAGLARLIVSAGALEPAFAPGTTTYSVRLPAGTSSFTVTASASDSSATMVLQQDGNAPATLRNGVACNALSAPEAGGSSNVVLRVTAEDGVARRRYLLNVSLETASPSDDATLSALTVNAGRLTPIFAPDTADYAVELPYEALAFTVTPSARSSSASITLRQDFGAFASVQSGTACAALAAPAIGSSTSIEIRVTAQDGTAVRTYTLAVTAKGLEVASAPTLHLIGDATVANDDPMHPDWRGWGQELPPLLTGNLRFLNAAAGGQSSKTFYLDGHWASVKSKVKPGDFILIQFGHEDERDNGLEGSSGVGTDAWGSYHWYLSQYVEEARALKATAVLLTPVVRRQFSGNALTSAAAHDLTGNGTAVGNANYSAAVKDVGAVKSVPVIDLTSATKALVEQYGSADSKSILYASTDDSHLQAKGAALFARLAVKGLIAGGILVPYLNPTAALVLRPTALDFGSLSVGTSVDKPMSMAGLLLAPAAGAVTVSAPAGFLAGADCKGAFTTSLQIPYTGGELPPTHICARFAPSAALTYSGTLEIALDSGATQAVAVTGVGAAPPPTESSALYNLTSDTACAVSGPVSCARERLSGLSVDGYAFPNSVSTLWISDTGATLTPTSTTTQRLTTPDRYWPVEFDINPGRFAEFAVSPAQGKTLSVDRITLWIGSAGGRSMGYRILYSTESNFANPAPLLASTSNAKNTMVFRALSQSIRVNSGKALYLRIYPWNSAAALGRYLCLQGLEIHGTAQ